MTNAERLARIEAILEQSVSKSLDNLATEQAKFQEDVRESLKEIRADLDKDKADLAALKNRGAGILAGVALASGAVGASAKTLWQALTGS